MITIWVQFQLRGGFPGGSAGKESACNVGDLDSTPGLGRSPGEGKGYPFQFSGLENSMDCLVMGSQRVEHDWMTFSSEELRDERLCIQICAQWIWGRLCCLWVAWSSEYNHFSDFIQTIQNFGTRHSFLLLWLTTRKASSIPTQLPSQPVMQGPQCVQVVCMIQWTNRVSLESLKIITPWS